ncbi:VOC family protein [Periweissella ghanensis]|uniref:VOC domain-containing protein n=1 Tax=Periweissella ghanensis TaxID=467997 RepID=A0ABM8ZDZ8_9LACO|nr:VOC family protein [Periweissella ghanensis]MCM0601908.1 VOC family protein [Periweissella ghanensis]CAH0418901.1 hypothetical protein WGH24286_01344 [Periweissella ghanensis]
MAINEYVTGIQHIGIPTDDLAGTIAFYESLGFTQAGLFPNGANQCVFMKLDNVVIESWTGDAVTKTNGAINHISLDTTNIESTFAAAQAQGLELIDHEIQSIPSFWAHGIKYFNILGPNHEVIEFCQILTD